jgi:two-component system sensor histidine kinase KdpD
VVSFEFFFMPPYFEWSNEDSQYVFTFAVLLVVALLISGLASRAREQTEQARQRGRRTQILYAMTRELAGLSRPTEIADHAARNLSAVFGARAILTLPPAEATPPPGAMGNPAPGVLELPLVGSRGTMGVATLHFESSSPLPVESRDLLDSLIRQIAISLERALLAAQAERAEVEVERERLRSALLSSVSHDLRTPLSVIHGAASSLIGEHGLSAAARDDLGTTIYEESDRLNRLLGNLLDMTRVQSGDLKVAKEPHALEEIVGSAVRRLRHVLKDHVVHPALAADLPLVPLDALLIEQVLVNLLENAARYTPTGSRIDVRAGHDAAEATIEVADAGSGLPSLGAGSRLEHFDRTKSGGGPRPRHLPGDRGGAWRSDVGDQSRRRRGHSPLHPAAGLARHLALDVFPAGSWRPLISPPWRRSSSSSRTSRRCAGSCAPPYRRGVPPRRGGVGRRSAERGGGAPPRSRPARPRPSRHGRPEGHRGIA